MNDTTYPNPLGELNPVSDAEAARLAGPETHALLLESILADTGVRDSRRSTRFESRAHVAWRAMHRRTLLLGGVVAVAAVLVVVLPGSLAGSRVSTEPPAAQAQILAHIAAALSRGPGTIVIEDARTQLFPGASIRRKSLTFSSEMITETSTTGHQERTFRSASYLRSGDQLVDTPSWSAIYTATDNTISTVTEDVGVPTVAPSQASVFERKLRKHLYRLAGRSTIDGRPALKLVPVTRSVVSSRV